MEMWLLRYRRGPASGAVEQVNDARGMIRLEQRLSCLMATPSRMRVRDVRQRALRTSAHRRYRCLPGRPGPPTPKLADNELIRHVRDRRPRA